MENSRLIEKASKKRIWLKALVWFILKLVVTGFFVFNSIIYFYQDKLLFISHGISAQTINEIHKEYPKVEDITLTTADNVKLRGWLVRQSNIKKAPLIIYFGGNGEEVSDVIEDSNKFNGWDIALLNYRGYGQSQGKPSEKSLFSDALSVYDYFSKREEVDSQRIVVMGRSLGTGVATYLAQNRPVKGVILVTPYDSITSVAQEKFSFVPVSILLKNKFDSISIAPLIKTPLLVLIAENDEVIPPHHAYNLTENWLGNKTLKVISGEGHNTIQNGDGYWDSIKKFLEQF